MRSFRAPAFALLAGILWGSLGLFVRLLNAAGLYALEVAQLRFLLGAFFVGLYLLIFHRDKFRVRVRDLWCFLGTGLCSQLFFLMVLLYRHQCSQPFRHERASLYRADLRDAAELPAVS